MKSCTHLIRQECTTRSHIAQRTSTAFVCFISAAILQSPVKIFAAGVRTVALSGQSAPSVSGGVTYESFGSHYDSFAGRFFRGPALNDAGQTAFRAGLTGRGVGSTNNQGVWSEGSGYLALVARTGNQVAGAPGGVNFRIDPARYEASARNSDRSAEDAEREGSFLSQPPNADGSCCNTAENRLECTAFAGLFGCSV